MREEDGMAEQTEQSQKHQVFDFAVRNALRNFDVSEGEEVEIKIFVTNVSNNPIHEYRVERA
jgi:hypothetical protein